MRLRSLFPLILLVALALSSVGADPEEVVDAPAATDEATAESPSEVDSASTDATEGDGTSASDADTSLDDATEGEECDIDDTDGKAPSAEDDSPIPEGTADATDSSAAGSDGAEADESSKEASPPVQSGPFIDLLGETLLSLEMVDESHAQIHQHYTNEILSGKKVIGLYFSADWCGPCRQFTPDLVNFYDKMNRRRGKEDEFQIVWVSRCRDFNSFGQYFTHMNWLALPFEEAAGQRGQMLSNKYKVKGIPTLVLLDEVGGVITTDARNKIPADKAGIGFPWRNPLATLYMTVVPRSLRFMLKTQVTAAKEKISNVLKGGTGKVAA